MADPAVELLEKFCKFDAETLACATEDCMFNPPGAPPMPIGMVLDLMNGSKAAFPEWKSVTHGVTKNEDGTYTVLTQQLIGPMKGDFPAMGPFPSVAVATAAEAAKEDLKWPVEVGTFTLSADGTKVAGGTYDGAIKEVEGVDVSPSVTAIWNKKGDQSDTGFGAAFIIMGSPLGPPPAPPAADPAVELLEKFCKFDADTLACATDDCMFNPPGAPPMPIGMVLDLMNGSKAAFPEWKSVTHGVSKNEDGSYTVLTQQLIGPMKGDFPAMGPFPSVSVETAAAEAKEDLKWPVEVGTFTLSADGAKVAGGTYNGAIEEVAGVEVSPCVSAIWNKKGDQSDTGFGAAFMIMGSPLPPPPAAA